MAQLSAELNCSDESYTYIDLVHRHISESSESEQQDGAAEQKAEDQTGLGFHNFINDLCIQSIDIYYNCSFASNRQVM